MFEYWFFLSEWELSNLFWLLIIDGDLIHILFKLVKRFRAIWVKTIFINRLISNIHGTRNFYFRLERIFFGRVIWSLSFQLDISVDWVFALALGYWSLTVHVFWLSLWLISWLGLLMRFISLPNVILDNAHSCFREVATILHFCEILKITLNMTRDLHISESDLFSRRLWCESVFVHELVNFHAALTIF